MKIIFDSGSTKTTVALCTGRNVSMATLKRGFNAAIESTDNLRNLILDCDAINHSLHNVGATYFYGAGCGSDECCGSVAEILRSIFTNTHNVEVHSDMLGAARAVCGHNPGIVCILGTGSNSCFYNGNDITEQTPSLGYILGDEGSGAVIGRRFLGMMLKGVLPKELKDRFDEKYNLSINDIINQVYRQPKANAFLASFAPFILANADIEDVNEFLIDEFSKFITYNLKNYSQFHKVPIHFIGSIAHNFRPYIEAAMNNHNAKIGTIIKAPLENLIKYHLE